MKYLLLVMISLTISFSAIAKDNFFFDKSITIKELAQKNKIAPFKLLHELDDELGIISAKGTSIVKDIGLTKKQFSKLYLHMNEELTPLIIFGMILWILMGIATLYWIKKKKLTPNKRIFLFLISIMFFGVILHTKPGAMEAIVKLFKATAGKDSWHLKILFFSFFSIFSLAASNLFCSIGCQIGAIQDLIFQLFRKKKIKYKKVPFGITNGIRIILFTAFILFMYNILTGLKSASLYHSVNIFKVYIWGVGVIGIVTFILTVLLSGIVYRPYCSLICPFGLWSWAISHLSFLKIKIDKEACSNCQACVQACPNDSMKSILNNNLIKKDCYSCGECINHCPNRCISFK